MHLAGGRSTTIIINVCFIKTWITEVETFSEDKRILSFFKQTYFFFFWLSVPRSMVRCKKDGGPHGLRHLSHK